MQKLAFRKKMKGLGIGDIGPVALAIGISVIIVSVVAMILGNMNTNITDDNATYVLTKGLAATKLFADWFNIMVIVVVSVIVLGLVMLLRRFGGGRE